MKLEGKIEKIEHSGICVRVTTSILIRSMPPEPFENEYHGDKKAFQEAHEEWKKKMDDWKKLRELFSSFCNQNNDSLIISRSQNPLL